MASSVTLDAIALEAGLSKATVSRALSGHPRVATATRERITAIAARLGYHPDAALSALARRRWPDGRRPEGTRLIYLHSLRLGIHERLQLYRKVSAELGYDLAVARLDEVGDPEAYGRLLDQRGIRGVILHSVDDERDGAPTLIRSARVIIGFGFEGIQAHRIMADFSHNLRMAVDEVVARGYQRIGFLGTLNPSHRRRRLLDEQFTLRRLEMEQAHGPQPGIHWHRRGDSSTAVERWLEEERPEVVVADHVERCEELLARGGGLSRHLGLVGLVNRSRIAPDEALSQVNVRRLTVFRHALHVLHDALLREEFAEPDVPVRILIPGHWHEGHTLPLRKG